MTTEQAASPFDSIIQRSPDPDIPDIIFSDLLPFIRRGASDIEILKEFPDLKEKKLLKARNLYAAKISPHQTDRGLSVLCDENVSMHHLHVCQNAFNYATSIGFEGMAGMSDQQVWDYAQANGFDLIVTKDKRNKEARDLTRIAVCAWRDAITAAPTETQALSNLPVLLHLTGDAKEGAHFEAMLGRHLSDIFKSRAAFSAPVIRVHNEGVYPEISVDDVLRAIDTIQPVRNLSRQEQWARKFLRKTLPCNRHADREDPKVIDIKRKVTRAVAIATRGMDQPVARPAIA